MQIIDDLRALPDHYRAAILPSLRSNHGPRGILGPRGEPDPEPEPIDNRHARRKAAAIDRKRRRLLRRVASDAAA